MRIESINILGFGCLANKRYEFPADRAALIVADNETGKSTLAAAILAGLCGFPKRKQAGEPVKLSEVYKPWDCEQYAVEMEVLVGGQRLHIERDFARDTFIVRDRNTGKDISAEYDTDLCAHFLHLPREDFQRIAFIRGKEAPSFDRTETIRSRLSKLTEGSGDDASAEVAVSALDAARYTFESALTIPNAIKRIREQREQKRARLETLERDLEQVADDAERLDHAMTRVEELRAELDALDEEYQAAVEAEQKASTESTRRQEAQTALKEAELRLAQIDKKRASARSVWVAVTAGGITLGIVSFLGWAAAVPSMATTLVGISVAAAGGVQAGKAGLLDAQERISLEGELERLQSVLAEPPPTPSGAQSFIIDGQRRDRRRELDEANDEARRLYSTVGSAVDAYKREVPALQEELRRLGAELAKAERFGQSIALAREVLAEVAEESHRRWAVALNTGASTILPHLNPDYEDLRFDDSLDFTVRRISDGRILEQADIDARLSTGAKDQVYLAVRLAFCQELSMGGESIPVLLDDPFIAADDTRFARGMQYIAEESAREHQILILSCAKQRHEALAAESWFAGNVHRLAV